MECEGCLETFFSRKKWKDHIELTQCKFAYENIDMDEMEFNPIFGQNNEQMDDESIGGGIFVNFNTEFGGSISDYGSKYSDMEGVHTPDDHSHPSFSIFNDLSGKERLEAICIGEIFPYVSREIREKLMEKVIGDPNCELLPKSRTSWTSASVRLWDKIEAPLFYYDTINLKGEKRPTRLGLMICYHNLGYTKVIDWVRYWFKNPDWSKMLQQWSSNVSMDGVKREKWDGDLFKRSNIQSDSFVN